MSGLGGRRGLKCWLLAGTWLILVLVFAHLSGADCVDGDTGANRCQPSTTSTVGAP